MIKKVIKRVLVNSHQIIPFNLANKILRSLDKPYSVEEDNNRLIFIHVPKVAGNAVSSSLLGKEGTGHFKISQYSNCNREKFEQYFKVGFVRNPWDRFYSAYSYLESGGRGVLDRRFKRKYLKDISCFRDFVMKMEEPKFRKSILSWIHFQPQEDFVTLNGKVSLDFLGRYESLDEDYAKLAEILNLKVRTLKKINITNTKLNKRDYRAEYDDETKKVIHHIYKNDIELLNYEF